MSTDTASSVETIDTVENAETTGTSPAPSSGHAVPFADCFISPPARDSAQRVLRSGWVTTGHEVVAFEREFADSIGSRHAVAVSSCTAGLELALRSLGLPRDSVVLTSTNTFCGAVHAIIHAGLRPELVDVDLVTGMPTPSTTAAARERIARQGRSPEAMVVVHWSGDPADVPALAEAAGLPTSRVVEDAAHAVGTETPSGPVGRDSAAACFSFYATKNLPIGEGGMITTDDDALAAAWRQNRLHGMSKDAWRRYQPGGSWQYDVAACGLKANMSDVQASIGRAQMTYLPAWQRRRGEIAARYDDGLTRLRGIALPHRPAAGTGQHAWHLYAIRVLPESGLTRDQLAAALDERGVGTSVHFIPLHHFTAARTGAYGEHGPLPGADAFGAQVLSLPIYPRLLDTQVDLVVAAIADSLGPVVPRQGRNPRWLP